MVTDELFPLVLLLCDSNPFSIVRYFEKALCKLVNVISIYLDVHEWFIKKFFIPKLLYKFLKLRLSHVRPIPRNPDIILVIEPPLKIHYDLRMFKDSIKIFYALDPHTENAIDNYMKCKVWEYDFVFVGQKDYIPMFKEMGCEKVLWLPYAYDPDVFREIKGLVKEYDIAFLGYMNEERQRILNNLKQRYKLFTTENRYMLMHDASIAYSKSKIALQISNRKTLGARIFEAMGCRRMVLADKIKNGLDEIFTDKLNIVLYSDVEELIELAEYYLVNEDEREKVANNGYRLVSSGHTYDDRVVKLFELLRIKIPYR